MHKHIILFFSVLLIFSACGDKTPEGIIDQPKMTSLLTDIHLADGALYSVPQQPDSLYKYGAAKYTAIFKKYKITDKEFKKSFQYYSTKPEVIEKMYDQIAANIQAKTDSLTKTDKKHPKKNALPPQ
jgi:hypothetical protein